MAQQIRWRQEIGRLEAAPRPIANRPVNLSDPNWLTNLGLSNPLDEAGVRHEAEILLVEILEYYAAATDAERIAIRKLYEEHPSFAWAAGPPALRKMPGPGFALT